MGTKALFTLFKKSLQLSSEVDRACSILFSTVGETKAYT